MKSFAKPLQRALLPETEETESEPVKEVKVTAKPQPEAVTKLTAEEQALRDSFIAARKRESKRREDNTDSEYWFCIGFVSREQKEEFLQKSGLLADGDKYLNGEVLAQRMGINLESPKPKLHSKFTFNKRLLNYARPLQGKKT